MYNSTYLQTVGEYITSGYILKVDTRLLIKYKRELINELIKYRKYENIVIYNSYIKYLSKLIINRGELYA